VPPVDPGAPDGDTEDGDPLSGYGPRRTRAQEEPVSDSTFAITHLVGTSSTSIDDAIRNGIKTAAKSLRNLDWFEVTEIRGSLGHSAEVQQFQVTLKLGFRYE
jgi:dodecin